MIIVKHSEVLIQEICTNFVSASPRGVKINMRDKNVKANNNCLRKIVVNTFSVSNKGYLTQMRYFTSATSSEVRSLTEVSNNLKIILESVSDFFFINELFHCKKSYTAFSWKNIIN